MPESRASSVPIGVDRTVPSIARAYDYALGGKDNYEVDREVVGQVQAVLPETFELAVENRHFLIRVCRFLATQTGVNQFVDCGSGLPTAENVHEAVHRVNRDAKIVYIDNDPVVLAHGRALLENDANTRFVAADIHEPEELLNDEVLREEIDFDEPIAFLQFGTLHHFVGSTGEASEIMRQYVDALPFGSYVAISHFLDPEDEYTEKARQVEATIHELFRGAGTFRTKSEIESLFQGLEFVEPGVVRCVDWWPDGPVLGELNLSQRFIAGGVARKP